MASQHDNILPLYLNTQFEGDIEQMMDICFAEATLTNVDYQGDLCNLTMTVDTGSGTKELISRSNVPIHYHCPKKATVDGGSIAFKVNDTVLVCNWSGNCDWRNDEIKVIGFPNMLKACQPYIYIYMNSMGFLWDVNENAYATGIRNPRYGNPSYPDSKEFFEFPEPDSTGTDFYVWRTQHTQSVKEVISETVTFNPYGWGSANCAPETWVETTFVKNDQTFAWKTKQCTDANNYTYTDEINYTWFTPSQYAIKDNPDILFAVHVSKIDYHSEVDTHDFTYSGDISDWTGSTDDTWEHQTESDLKLATPLGEEIITFMDSRNFGELHTTWAETCDAVNDHASEDKSVIDGTALLHRMSSVVAIHRESGVMVQLYLFAACLSERTQRWAYTAHLVGDPFQGPPGGESYGDFFSHPNTCCFGQTGHNLYWTAYDIETDVTTYGTKQFYCHAMADVVDNLVDVDNKIVFDIHAQSYRSPDFEAAISALYALTPVVDCGGYAPTFNYDIVKLK